MVLCFFSRLKQVYQKTNISLFTQKERSKSRSHGMDLLRFLLAFWVLFSHSLSGALHTGHIDKSSWLYIFFIKGSREFLFQRYAETHPAVLGFIFLSGYCIHRNGFRFGVISSFKNFFIRRGFRILPIYWLGIATGVFFFFKCFDLSPLKAQALLATKSIGWVPILLKLIGLSSFVPALHQLSFQGNGVLTTVMVEVWLYIAYGLTYFFCLRKKIPLKKITCILGAIWALSFLLALVHPAYRGWWHNGSFISFSLYWWIGAYFVEFKEKKNFFVKKFIILACLCVVLSPFIKLFIFSELKKISIVYLFGLLVLKIESRKRDIPSALGSVGHISYSLYALHGPIIVYCFLIGLNLIHTFSILFFIVFFVYTFYEAPFLRYGKEMGK